MGFGITSNYAANVAHRHARRADAGLSLSLAKLSAGRRVLSAKDDAAALAIGSRLAAETSGLQQAQVNAGQGRSMLQVADGGLARASDILVRMKTLAVQAGSGQLSGSERAALNTEYQALASEVDRIAADTEFAGTSLLDGSTGSVDIKAGTGTSPSADDITVALANGTAAALSIAGTDITSAASADAASSAISNAIDTVQTARARIGADQNRLGFAEANIATTIENTEAARSDLIDLDVAREATTLASRKVLMQVSLAMLDHANQKPKATLRLLA